ncbi:hypothetical protein RJ639_018278 [Escallonia herrerae]|uniref:HIT domain-containing protein n=1 Tax=Escallonia herrerae TaxID=1293975 RepID=A0AA88V9M7_9ASTE|nr:hypothetical protein RJ639_018278 [Escallonia herrerae]
MEARRRLALIASHLRPITSTPECSTTRVSTSHCHSDSDSHEANQVTDCVFCKIVHGEAPALKLYEDDICICILDTFPLSHGHSLIIPKCHFSSLEATPPAVVAAMCSKVPYISNAVMKATACGTNPNSFNLLVNSGTAAGQVIFHTHIHIIPRKARDCLWTSESLRRCPLRLDQEALRLADCVREQLSFSGKSEDSKGQASSHVEN